MKTLLISALLMTASASTDAATDEISKSADYSKGKIIAITEQGPHAVDAAHLLAIQNILHPAYKPELMVVENTRIAEVEAEYNLSTVDLPVFIFLNSKGNEIGRITGGPLTAVGRYVANNSAILDQ